MKNNISKVFKIFLIFSVIVCACYGLFYYFDNVWNGLFVDWFEKKFMKFQYEWYEESDWAQYYTTRVVEWSELKYFVLKLGIIAIIIIVAISMIYSSIVVKVRTRKNVSKLSGLIKQYMAEDVQAAEIFPIEFAEISAQMADLKVDLNKHEQLLKEEAGKKNDLIAYLAHDLKTPLTSVIGYLSLLNEAEDLPRSMQEKYLEISLRKAKRLEVLINEFFEITRYNLNQIKLEKERIDLSYMLYQMSDEFYPQLNKKNNKINLEISDNIFIEGDPNKLARVFNNIIKNAITYSFTDSEIVIFSREIDDGIEIGIKNKGKTISEEKLKTIFDKFVRLDDARNVNTGGAGLGLAIAREIISLHGGTITAQSELDITTFVVFLPNS